MVGWWDGGMGKSKKVKEFKSLRVKKLKSLFKNYKMKYTCFSANLYPDSYREGQAKKLSKYCCDNHPSR